MKNNRIVTTKNVKIGLKVIRGRDWGYGDQDGHSDYGILVEDSYDDEWVRVNWLDGYSNRYRIGNTENDPCDLYLYELPFIVDEKFHKEAKKLFKMNNIENITVEMLKEKGLEKWILK